MRFLSGVQPSGKLHLGNYFGYIRPNLAWQGKSEASYLMIADLHALTTVHDPAALREATSDVALDFLACGLDPEKAILFRQSRIPEHTELMWILAAVCPIGLLERAVSYKEKVQRGLSGSAGLFTYPVLQTADILLYDIDKVPVGKDQKQHLEIARDLALKFNAAFGDVLVVPEGVIEEEVALVPGTDGQKMSKSYGNLIPIFGSEKEIQKAIMGIVTDSKDVAAPKDPETCTVYRLHRLFLSKGEAAALADRYRAGGLGYGEAKKMLFSAYMDHFGPMRAKRTVLQAKAGLVTEVLEAAEKKARKYAGATMERVRKAVGLR